MSGWISDLRIETLLADVKRLLPQHYDTVREIEEQLANKDQYEEEAFVVDVCERTGLVDVESVDEIARLLDRGEKDHTTIDELRDVLIEADILSPSDENSDPIMLLRMFLPVD